MRNGYFSALLIAAAAMFLFSSGHGNARGPLLPSASGLSAATGDLAIVEKVRRGSRGRIKWKRRGGGSFGSRRSNGRSTTRSFSGGTRRAAGVSRSYRGSNMRRYKGRTGSTRGITTGTSRVAGVSRSYRGSNMRRYRGSTPSRQGSARNLGRVNPRAVSRTRTPTATSRSQRRYGNQAGRQVGRTGVNQGVGGPYVDLDRQRRRSGTRSSGGRKQTASRGSGSRSSKGYHRGKGGGKYGKHRPGHKYKRHRKRHGSFRHYYGGWFYTYPWWAYTVPVYAAVTYQDDYYDDPHVQWCLERYKSYDIETDTYLAYSGVRRYCNSPYL